ncbi:MAG: YceI family protein [Candidatus Dormibacteraeota bacterium]|nr:YceI family protein [Candidatus Dormibacteraeota bacterium]
MRRGAIGVLAVVVVVALGAIGAYLYFFSGLRSAPKPLALASPQASAAPSTAASPSGTLAGTWSIGQGSLVGYRVREQFVGQSSPHEAVARTSSVSGGLAVQQSSSALQATNINFTAQLSGLQSVDQVAGYNVSQRDRFVSRSLDVQQFPDATFKAASVSLPAGAGAGQDITLAVPGQLTIHGVTKDATATVKARVNGSQLDLAGSTPATMTDFGITPPQVPFTTSESKVTIEFNLVLTKAA